MENTLENKAKFFAQYYGQKVYFVNQEGYNDEISDVPFNRLNWSLNWCMLLTPLSQITDEDALHFGRIINDYPDSKYYDNLDYCRELIKRFTLRNGLIQIDVADYLRSKGYALPWMELSVEKLIEYGWVKLKD